MSRDKSCTDDVVLQTRASLIICIHSGNIGECCFRPLSVFGLFSEHAKNEVGCNGSVSHFVVWRAMPSSRRLRRIGHNSTL
eukprot:552768-Amphidinium_carterae.2